MTTTTRITTLTMVRVMTSMISGAAPAETTEAEVRHFILFSSHLLIPLCQITTSPSSVCLLLSVSTVGSLIISHRILSRLGSEPQHVGNVYVPEKMICTAVLISTAVSLTSRDHRNRHAKYARDNLSYRHSTKEPSSYST